MSSGTPQASRLGIANVWLETARAAYAGTRADPEAAWLRAELNAVPEGDAEDDDDEED